MAEPKALAPSAKLAVDKILSQQKSKHWDGQAHAWAIATLAQNAISNGVLDKAGLASSLQSEPWGFVSNMKKRLESLKLIPESVEKTSEYQ
jgi:hypothetical protein